MLSLRTRALTCIIHIFSCSATRLRDWRIVLPVCRGWEAYHIKIVIYISKGSMQLHTSSSDARIPIPKPTQVFVEAIACALGGAVHMLNICLRCI